ncbi:MAG: PilZ domain-containing protein [Gammaproteobacteria bacterium]|nr:PilZ domain-containing protein [Gammaproteobacteria bacterium]
MTRPQKITPMYKIFESRRQFPRLIMNIPAVVTGSGGKRFKVILYDLSPDGAQIRYLIQDGVNLFPGTNISIKNITSLKCILQFKLSYKGVIQKIKVIAYPVYIRSIDDKTSASGMLFDRKDAAENKKINDFLFHQVETTFYEFENLKMDKPKMKSTEKTKEGVKKPDLIEDKLPSSPKTTKEIRENDYSINDLQSLKHELAQIIGSLKVIQETTRHIDERIYVLEQKLSRRT